MATLELLMITHNRLEYLKKALPSVLNQTGNFKLTIWDNDSAPKTVSWLKSLKLDNVRIFFNWDNESLASVTTRVFRKSSAEFVGKIDPDIILPPDWAKKLTAKHQERHYGFLGGLHFRSEDLKELKPIIENGVWHKSHIGGNFIVRREDFKGYKGEGVMGLSEYQIELGLPNGYLWNLWIEHMEDKRSEHYIDNSEYNDYKLKTRGVSLEKYQTGIANPNYLKENTL